MPFRDLREFIDAIDKMGELRHVDGADPHLEIGATHVPSQARADSRPY